MVTVTIFRLIGVAALLSTATPAFAQTTGKIRDEFQQLLDWATASPPLVDQEKLQAAELGPFVRLKELQARRGPHGS